MVKDIEYVKIYHTPLQGLKNIIFKLASWTMSPQIFLDLDKSGLLNIRN